MFYYLLRCRWTIGGSLKLQKNGESETSPLKCGTFELRFLFPVELPCLRTEIFVRTHSGNPLLAELPLYLAEAVYKLRLKLAPKIPKHRRTFSVELPRLRTEIFVRTHSGNPLLAELPLVELPRLRTEIFLCERTMGTHTWQNCRQNCPVSEPRSYVRTHGANALDQNWNIQDV